MVPRPKSLSRSARHANFVQPTDHCGLARVGLLLDSDPCRVHGLWLHVQAHRLWIQSYIQPPLQRKSSAGSVSFDESPLPFLVFEGFHATLTNAVVLAVVLYCSRLFAGTLHKGSQQSLEGMGPPAGPAGLSMILAPLVLEWLCSCHLCFAAGGFEVRRIPILWRHWLARAYLFASFRCRTHCGRTDERGWQSPSSSSHPLCDERDVSRTGGRGTVGGRQPPRIWRLT